MTDNKNRCDKYEGCFVFKNEEELNEHIKECESCREEHEKYLKVSELIKEVTPAYLERESKKKMMTAAKRLACCFVLFIGLSAFTGYKIYDNYTYQVSMEEESSVSEMGLPIDEYGFLSL